MAAAAAASLLDELMGRNRNVGPDEKPPETRWTDSDVCKYYLCGFCPHELFVNTKADLGPCNKLHDDGLRAEFQQSPQFERRRYEEDFMDFMQQIVADKERRVKRAQARLVLTASKSAQQAETTNAKDQEKLDLLTDKVNELVQKIEMLGNEGKVEEAQGMMKLVDELKEERETLRGPSTDMQSTLPEKQMEVCLVCSAFLIVGDAQSRVDDHLMGKQHMGYARIKAKIEEILQKRNKEQEEREAERRKLMEEREKTLAERQKAKEVEKEKEKDSSKEREDNVRDRHRDRDRNRDDRRRDRYSSRGDDRYNSRDTRHYRHRDDRNSDRNSRYGGRERSGGDRDRKRNERRSRDRDRSRRSRSRNRSRSKEDTRHRKHSSPDHPVKESSKGEDQTNDTKDNDDTVEGVSKPAEDNVSNNVAENGINMDEVD